MLWRIEHDVHRRTAKKSAAYSNEGPEAIASGPSSSALFLARYFSLNSAEMLESSAVVSVTLKQKPASLGVCQFWMNCPAVVS